MKWWSLDGKYPSFINVENGSKWLLVAANDSQAELQKLGVLSFIQILFLMYSV